MKYAFMAVAALVLIGFGIWVWSVNYDECRSHGFSKMYCMTRR